MIFFVDRSLGRKHVVEALRAAGQEAIAHDDRFPPDLPDVDSLAEAGRNGWVVLTKDKRIRTRGLERDALRAAKVRAFIVTTGNLTGAELAALVARALPNVVRIAGETAPPFIARITPVDVALYE